MKLRSVVGGATLAGALGLVLSNPDSVACVTDRTSRAMNYYCALSHGEALANPAARLLLSVAMASRQSTEAIGADQAGDRTAVCTRSYGKPPALGNSASGQAVSGADFGPPRS